VTPLRSATERKGFPGLGNGDEPFDSAVPAFQDLGGVR